MKTIKWFARFSALAIVLFALPFYFGYGNPLPFVGVKSLWENVALSMVPLVFIGLVLGWPFPRAGGYLTVIPVAIAFAVGIFTQANMTVNLAAPIVPGVLYLVYGYGQRNIGLNK